MGHGTAVVLVAMGRPHRQASSKGLDPPPDRSIELAQRYVQGDIARSVVAKLGSRKNPLRSEPHGEGVDKMQDPIQDVGNANAGIFAPLQTVAQDKDAWVTLEATFVQKLAGVAHAHSTVPRGRWMIGETVKHHRSAMHFVVYSHTREAAILDEATSMHTSPASAVGKTIAGETEARQRKLQIVNEHSDGFGKSLHTLKVIRSGERSVRSEPGLAEAGFNNEERVAERGGWRPSHIVLEGWEPEADRDTIESDFGHLAKVIPQIANMCQRGRAPRK